MNLRSFYFYNLNISKLFKTDLKLFELSVWLQTFGQSLISVFIPIILWKAGLGVKDILLFYLIFSALDIPLNFLARNLIVRFGARIVMIFSIFVEVIYLALLYNVNAHWLVIVLLAFSFALFDALYWVAQAYIFIQSSRASESMRKDVGALTFIRNLGGLLAPAIGGWILVLGGPRTLVFISTLLMFGSLLPLFSMRRLHFKPEHKPVSFAEFFREPAEKINYFFEMCSAINADIEDIIWPFFIFLLFNSIKIVAVVPIVISLAGLVVVWIAGQIKVRENIYRMIAIGGLFLAMLWTARLYNTSNLLVIYSTVFLIGLMSLFVDVPADIAIFERGSNVHTLGVATYRNALRSAARLVMYGALFLTTTVFRPAFYLAIGLMLIMCLMALFASRKLGKEVVISKEPPEVALLEPEQP